MYKSRITKEVCSNQTPKDNSLTDHRKIHVNDQIDGKICQWMISVLNCDAVVSALMEAVNFKSTEFTGISSF